MVTKAETKVNFGFCDGRIIGNAGVIERTGQVQVGVVSMQSSKNLHRLGVAKPNTMNASCTQPMVSTISPVQHIQKANNNSQTISADPPPLFMAVISAQKTTIGGLQLDLIEARAKIEKLQVKCAAAEVVVATQAKYKRLHDECKAGYEAGVQHGIKKVRLFQNKL